MAAIKPVTRAKVSFDKDFAFLPDRAQASIVAFNGKPATSGNNKGKPVILPHARVDAIASTVVLTGVLQKTSAPYGT